MKFYEVQPALEAGTKIRLSYWRKSLSLVIDNTTIYGYSYALFENGNVIMIWNPSEAELRSDDWEIVDGIPEVKLRVTEYFICPSCQHKNYGFHLDNGISICDKCGQRVRTLPRL